ncbi:MAG: hypothetical protein GAK43_02475 [Stenotrophomonas maltophilia]|nr:MAG: hypothetical protein GAK43_02475 [Stenotrophomonas maltophilia]
MLRDGLSTSIVLSADNAVRYSPYAEHCHAVTHALSPHAGIAS